MMLEQSQQRQQKQTQSNSNRCRFSLFRYKNNHYRKKDICIIKIIISVVTMMVLMLELLLIKQQPNVMLLIVNGVSSFPFLRHYKKRQRYTPQSSSRSFRSSSLKAGNTESNIASLCIIGGGISGLTAAITAAKYSNKTNTNIVLLESSSTLGGRVQSDLSDDGNFVLDRGFAVYIEEYPYSKQLFTSSNDHDDDDYIAKAATKLQFNKFLPGAYVKVDESSDTLERVVDPIRQPFQILTAVLANVGTLYDKLKLLPLIYHVKTTSIDDIFKEDETSTIMALQQRWKFSNQIIDSFFKPFLEGIYLAPLEEQSSRMFTFIMKMFTDGAATLPTNGMGSIAQHLVDRATLHGVTIRTQSSVTRIQKDATSGLYTIQCQGNSAGSDIVAETVIIATDGTNAKKLLSTMEELQYLNNEEDQTQRSVGCLYYSFTGTPPISEPILILNGIDRTRGTALHPINNICFPTVVSSSYYCTSSSATETESKQLCSVTILKDAMTIYENKDAELDKAVRKQLSSWFPSYNEKIINDWKLERIYKIHNAQPSQLHGIQPANFNGGRDCSTYRNRPLPVGLYICGDHVATATLNGAIESGINAGMAAITTLQRKIDTPIIK